MDVKNTFSNKDLHKDVCMTQAKSFEYKEFSNKEYNL